MGRRPIVDIVDVALMQCGHNEIIIAHAHIDDSLLEVQIFIHLCEDVCHCYFILSCELCLPVAMSHHFINYLAEKDITCCTGTDHHGAIH